MRRIFGVGVVLAGVGVACDEPVNACDDYVAYMCDCHPEVDCAELQATLGDASPAVQDQCVIDLEDQQAEDDAAALECPV